MASDIKGVDKYFFHHHKDKIKEEVEKYEAKEYKSEVKFKKCDHKDAKVIGQEIRCRCGAAWRGANLIKLFNLLTKNNK